MNLILKGRRSITTDSLFILVSLPGKVSSPEDAHDEVKAGGDTNPLVAPNSTSGTLRQFFLNIFLLYMGIINLLLDVLLCSIAKYFYELCRIVTSP